MYRDVKELNRAELEELKEAYLFEVTDGPLSWSEIAAAQNIPDEIVFDHYAGYVFTSDDFTCNMEGE